jgi:preprotein translocase subunit SecG
VRTVYYILLGLGILISIVFVAIIYFTGKGDAMSSGGSGIRTTFKGKANFEDQISRLTLILGISFIGLMLVLDWLSNQAFE